MYASDFPHPESDWPHSVDNVLKWGNILGPPAMKNLLSANADAISDELTARGQERWISRRR